MSKITFNCPHCNQPLCIDSSKAGMNARCSKCQDPIVIPQTEPAAPVQPQPVVQILGDCPYCRTKMTDKDSVRKCPNCETPHHEDCWAENKGCTVFGCTMAPPEEEKVAVQLPTSPGSQAGAMAGMYASSAAVTEFDEEYEEAGLGRRFGNWFLDYFMFLFTVFIFWMLMAVFAAAFESDLNGLLGFEFIINLVIYAAYYISFEFLLGRTPAKYLTGTMVVAEDYSRPSIEKIIGRTLSRMVPFEPFSFFGHDPSGWHDRWSGTTVVLAKPIRKTSTVASIQSQAMPATGVPAR